MKGTLAIFLAISSSYLSPGLGGIAAAQTHTCDLAPPGIVGLWRGEDAMDSVTGTLGTLTNGVAFVAGEVGQAFCFNGTNSYVEVPDSVALRLTNELTIEFWVKRLRFDDSVEYCVEKGGDWTWGQQDYGVALNRASYNSCLSFHFAGGWRGAGSVNDTNWHHCAVVARNGDPDPQFYVDAVAQPVVYQEGASSLSLYPSTRPLHLGAQVDPVSGWNYFGNVVLDEVSIYSRALSADEIQAIYNAGSAGKCPNLPLPPSIVVQPIGGTVNAGSTAYFYVVARGATPAQFQWFLGTSPLEGQTNTSLSLPNVQPAQAGLYSVTVSNAYGVATSSNALLTVLAIPPAITLQPQGLSIYAGKDVLLRIRATGTPPLSYQWYHDNLPVLSGVASGGQSTNLTLTNVQFAASGNYWITVSNAFGFVASSNAVLTVLPPPPCMPPPRGIVAWWRAEHNAMDSVGINDLLWTTPPSAFAYHGYSPGMVGFAFGSTLGSPQLLALPSSDLDLGNGAGLTIEGWICPFSGFLRPSPLPLVTWESTSRPGLLGRTGLQLALSGSGYPLMLSARFADTNPTPRSASFQSPSLVLASVWQHVALTFDRASGLALLYLNGEEVGRKDQVTITPATMAPVYLGAGSMLLEDEISLYNRALTAAEIRSIFEADLTGKCPPPAPDCLPTPPGIVGWWRGESNALDSVNGNNGAISNAGTYTNGEVGAAFRLTNGFVHIPAARALDVGTGPGFTVELWLQAEFPISRDLVRESLVRWGNTGTELSIAGPSEKFPTLPFSAFSATLVDTQDVSHLLSSAIDIPSASDWQHLALTYDRSSGRAALYLNGHAIGQTNFGSLTLKTVGDIDLGRASATYPARGLGPFVGELDEVAIYNRALTEAEIASIVAARGSGKCAQAPTILSQPQSQTVNLGETAVFLVAADGTPVLHYQWFFNGTPITNASDSILTLPSLQSNDAGAYSVVVSNQLGIAISSNAALRVNLPPLADASATRSLGISCNGSNAAVVLDGSKSSDPDGDALQYAWFENDTLLATGVVAVVPLPMGTNAITLQVSDGFATDEQTVSAAVINTAEAVQRLISRLEAEVEHPQALEAVLEASLNALQRDHCVAAIAELRAFQIVARVQLGRQNPSLAASLASTAESIIEAIESCCEGHEHQRLFPHIRNDQGHLHIEFPAVAGRTYLIEASSDLLHWQKIGVATDQNDGNFSFEDNGQGQDPARFYRIVPAD